MPKYSKNAFGKKSGIADAKANGGLDKFDVIYMDNGEIGWIDKNGNTVINTPRAQESYTLNGTNLGALDDGDTLPAEITFDEFLKLVTQRAIPAEYVKPAIGIANNGGQASGNVETGSSVIPKLKAAFTKNDAGNITAISILKNGVSVISGTSSQLTYSGGAFVIGDETVTYTASATYADAPVKNNNLGNESKENWFGGGTIVSSGYSITGKRNLFYGTGDGDIPDITSPNVRKLANKKLAPVQGYSWTIKVAVGQQYVMIAYPADLRDISKIRYEEANDNGMVSNFTKKIIDVADARGGSYGLKPYKIYTYKLAVPAAAEMTFEVTI